MSLVWFNGSVKGDEVVVLPLLDRGKWLQNAVACVGNARSLTPAGAERDELGGILLSLASMHKSATAAKERREVIAVPFTTELMRELVPHQEEKEQDFAIVVDGAVIGWCAASAIVDVLKEEPRAVFRPVSADEVGRLQKEETSGKKSASRGTGRKAKARKSADAKSGAGVPVKVEKVPE